MLFVQCRLTRNCPDDVIRKGYAFMDTVHSLRQQTDTEKELAFGEYRAAPDKRSSFDHAAQTAFIFRAEP